MREAYIKQIMILDEDQEEIATLDHDCDDMYLLKPLESKLMTADDMEFIAKVMHSIEGDCGAYMKETK